MENLNSIPEKLIWDAFDHGSRLIHIYPAKGKYEISYRTKVGLEKLTTIQEDSFNELDSSIATISTVVEDETSRRLYLHRGEEDVLQVKYQKIETITGPRVTLRLWQPEKDVLPLEKITGDKQVLAQFHNWLHKRSGLIIISGCTGSGKTTTVYSLINEFKNQGQVVFTIENSADLIIEGINQIEIKGKVQVQFEEVFDKVYASDPDVICLGLSSCFGMEEKVFTSAFKAASTGHLVIVQMDQSSCAEALSAFKKFVNYSVDSILVGVSCQKLVEENGKVKAIYEFLNQ
ncbi:MAG: ATPase, T2SS/T4P/T4SS family [Bdellovibrio sp.]